MRPAFFAVGFTLLAMAAGGPAAAESPLALTSEAAPQPALEPASADAAQVISVGEISTASEALRRTLSRDAEKLREDDRTKAIRQRLPLLAQQISQRRGDAESRLGDDPPLDSLTGLERDWEFRQHKLVGWRDELIDRIDALDKRLATYDDSAALWERTADAARQSAAPVELLELIRTTAEQLEQNRHATQQARAALLTLQSRINEQETIVADILLDAEQARRTARGRLFEPDSPTLWSALLHPVDPEAFRGRLQRSVRNDAIEAENYLSELIPRLANLLLVFAITLALARWVRRELASRREPGEPATGSAEVFARPFSVAALAVIIWSIGALEYAPTGVRDAIGVVLVVPMLRIIVPVVPRPLRSLVWVVAGFYFTDRIRDVIDGAPLLERLIYFVELVAASGFAFWLLRPPLLAQVPPQSRPPVLLERAIRVVAIATAFSAVANALGFVAISRVVGSGTLVAVYNGLLIFAAHRVATTLVLVLLGSKRLQHLAAIRHGTPRILAATHRGFAAVALFVWAWSALEGFALGESARDLLLTLARAQLPIGSLTFQVSDGLAFGITAWIAIVLARAIRFVLAEDVLDRVDLKRGVANAVSATVYYAVMLAGFVVALGAAGIDFGRITLLVSALGVGIGFGLQNIVNNFISGLILLFERPVQVGDLIQVGPTMGNITRIGIRSSTVRTFQGAEVILPNATLISDPLTNWTLSDSHRRVEVPIGVAYGTDHERAIEVLRGAVDRVSFFLSDPEPTVVFRGFGASAIEFEVRAWCQSTDWLAARNQLMAAVYVALGRAGIEIPFPQSDVHLRGLPGAVVEASRAGEGGDSGVVAADEPAP